MERDFTFGGNHRCCLAAEESVFVSGLQAVHATVDSLMQPAIHLDASGRLCGRVVSRRKLPSVQCRRRLWIQSTL